MERHFSEKQETNTDFGCGISGFSVSAAAEIRNPISEIEYFVDPEIAALQLEMHALELDISNLENEKSEVEKTIYAFEIQYNRALGQLLIDILALRRKIAEAHAAAHPDDAEAQERQEETENDYQSYHKTYEATRTKPLSTLTTDEKQVLKSRFREATKLCHPDTVAEVFKEKAQAVFIELKQAYDENNLARVTEIKSIYFYG